MGVNHRSALRRQALVAMMTCEKKTLEINIIFELFFKKKITLSRRLWYARVGLYVTPIRFGLLSTLTANQITDSKCVLVAAIFCTGTKYFLKY